MITSPANPRIREVRHLLTPRGRQKSGLFLMEGPHLLETLLDARMLPREIFFQPELLGRTSEGEALQERLRGLPGAQLTEVSERVMEAIGDTRTSQGVVSVLEMERFSAEQVRRRREQRQRRVLLVLDGLADPGNMGTILRTALAADVEAVLLTPDCVDYFSPKVVRSGAGAHISLPVEVDLTWEAIQERVVAHSAGRVLLAEAGGARTCYEEDLSQPCTLIVGNEAHGPSREGRVLATITIRIPLFNAVESLNVAMATGIILYEAVRQGIQTEGNA
ncbi:MAG: RNA methyltransferase [Ktedonobacteraceae bacterium]|nr:RNA methyltransferase [Ktedonobacteraceae bacterium]MBO0790756.1 RNA methyltransferase [Ktedonobacteraceae bacterium]